MIALHQSHKIYLEIFLRDLNKHFARVQKNLFFLLRFYHVARDFLLESQSNFKGGASSKKLNEERQI